jgi:photosystem II stability/assembly factor-like uncharacterized protein
MTKKVSVLKLVCLCSALLIFLVQPVWAGKPIETGINAPFIKIGEVGAKGDTYAPGHHSIASFGSDFFAVWVKGTFPNMDVVVNQTDEGKDVFLSDKIVSEGEYYGLGASIAVTEDPSDPLYMIVHVVWTNSNDEVKYSRSVTRVGSSLRSFQTPVILNTPGNGVNWGTTIAADNSGNVYVAWHSRAEENIYLTRSPDSGVTWSGPSLMYSSLARDLLPSLAVDSLGNVHLAWETTPGVGYLRSEDHGLSWSQPKIASDATAGHGNWPSIASVDGDDIYISWYDTSGVNCSYSSDRGVTWQQSLVSSERGFSSLAVSASGEVNVVHDAGGDVNLYRSKDGGVSWNTPHFLAYGDFPHVTMDQNNKAAFMWTYYGEIAAFTREK